MAEGCWAGLAAASVLPLAFAAATIAGWGWRRALALAILLDPVVLIGVGLLARSWGHPALPSLIVLVASTVAARRLGEPDPARRWDRPPLTPGRALALRTLVPVACLSVVLSLAARSGPALAGMLGTFPSVTLTALVLCRLEAGPVAAVRMARALPPGQWAMVAFLAAFRLLIPSLGLIGAAGVGYATAVASLLVVARLANPPIAHSWTAQLRHRRANAIAVPASAAVQAFAAAWPRPARRFSPRFEAATG